MKNSKTTKRAVLNSGMSLVVCSAMLIGTTFAWFTDTATTGVSTIKAGTLDVDLLDKEGESLEGKTLNWVLNTKGANQNGAVWEPGVTYYSEPFVFKNESTLGIKWKLTVEGFKGDKKLLDVLDIKIHQVVDGTIDTSEDFNGRESAFDPGMFEGNKAEFVVVAHMREEAGNTYQGMRLDGASVMLQAEQYASEFDSYSNQYDANAKYDENVKLTLDEVKEALKAGENLTLVKDLTVTSDETESSGYGKTGINHINGGLIDGNGNTLTVKDAKNTWDSVINTKGGTIKNLKVKGAFRGIFTGGLTSDLTIENVIFEDVTYTFSADASGDYNVIFKNSTLNGWTSYTSGFKSVSFINCNFGKGNGYAFMRPYNPTTLTNCEFEEGFKLDATKTSDIVLENCTVNGEEITQDNITTLLGANAAKAQVK